MAATKFTCPECGKVLRPAKPLPAGKRVKCPQCGTMFETQDDEIEAEAPVAKKSAKAGARSEAKAEAKAKPKPKAAKPKAAKKPAEAKPTAKAAAPSNGDDEDGPATYGYLDEHKKDDEPDIEYAPDTSIKDLRGPAQAAVISPSNYMILASTIGFFAYLIFAFIILIPLMFPVPTAVGPDGAPIIEKKQEVEKGKEAVGSMFMILTWDLMTVPEWPGWQITLLILGCAFGMVYCGVAIFGGVQMQTLTSRTWGIVSSILTMLPFLSTGTFAIICIILTFACGILFDREDMIWIVPIWVLLGYGPNLAFGIWGLITLLRPDVIEGYDFVPE